MPHKDTFEQSDKWWKPYKIHPNRESKHCLCRAACQQKKIKKGCTARSTRPLFCNPTLNLALHSGNGSMFDKNNICRFYVCGRIYIIQIFHKKTWKMYCCTKRQTLVRAAVASQCKLPEEDGMAYRYKGDLEFPGECTMWDTTVWRFFRENGKGRV